MYDNFDYLLERIIDAIKVSDINKICNQLQSIKGNTICTGSGGSSVISEFASKVLNIKNNCLCINIEPRDILYETINHFDNIFICSYTGSNYGVKSSLNNNLNKYLLTHGNIKNKDINLIQFKTSIDDESSFISLAATLIPMSILLCYYLGEKEAVKTIKKIFKDIKDIEIKDYKVYEIISGLDTIVPERFIESTLVESGIALPIVHHKYNYCHGRSTLAFHSDNALIYLKAKSKDIDKVILNKAKEIYKNITILDTEYEDLVIANYHLTIKAMFLCKSIATIKHKDLSIVKYIKGIGIFYYFKGEM
jgi:hypothetical protein